jgi:hypothetical protein
MTALPIEVTRLVKDHGPLTKRVPLADGTIVNVPANAKIRAINTKTRAKSVQQKPAPGRLRVISTHSHADRGLDAYWTPPEATTALLKIESVPRSVADPACGSGAILDVLRAAGHIVRGADIVDYGWPHTVVRDYLAGTVAMNGVAIVTNPPYRLAQRFIEKALGDGTRFAAFLLRLNFPEIHAPEGIFRDAPALKGLGVLAPAADDAQARMDRFQGAFESLLRVVRLGRVQREGPP